MSIEPKARGTCACGHVTYASSTPPLQATECHCAECRQISGAPYITFIRFDRSSITYSNAPRTVQLSDLAERAFCERCGSTISMWYFLHPHDIYMAGGSLIEESLGDGKEVLLKRTRIFLDQKAGWYDPPADGSSTYGRFGPGFEEEIIEWKKQKNAGTGKNEA